MTITPAETSELEIFFEAAWKGDNPVILEFLDKYGAAILNEKNWSDEPALMRALFGGHADTMALLLEKGADPELGDRNGWTALMWSVRYNPNYAITTLFLDGGADINKQDKNGDTALMIAAAAFDTKIVALLLERGADIYKKNWNGNTVLTRPDVRNPEIIALIEQHAALLEQRRKEQVFAEESAVIKKICLNGLSRPIPYKGPFKIPPAAGGK